jgi:hypothetical protein
MNLYVLGNKKGSFYPSPIQTILSALEFHQIHRKIVAILRVTGLGSMAPHRRSGISPYPEG